MRIITIFILVFSSFMSFGQGRWNIHLNVNEIYPGKNTDLTYYPVLWFDNATDKILVGGFGAGLSLDKSLSSKFGLLTQFNFQRSRFRDNPTILTDPNASRLGAISGINTSYTANLFAIPYLKAIGGDKMTLGIGLGLRSVIVSKTFYGESVVNGNVVKLNFNRQAASPFILFLPLRLRYQFRKFGIEAGFDYDLTNASRLRDIKEKYFTLQTGISFRLNNREEKEKLK